MKLNPSMILSCLVAVAVVLVLVDLVAPAKLDSATGEMKRSLSFGK